MFVILVFNVMELVGGAILDRPLWSSKECVCCVCGPSERLDALSQCFVYVLV